MLAAAEGHGRVGFEVWAASAVSGEHPGLPEVGICPLDGRPAFSISFDGFRLVWGFGPRGSCFPLKAV